MMSLGIVAALAYVAEQPDIFQYLEEKLIGERALPQRAKDGVGEIHFGAGANFSNYNMSFTGALLAGRYLCNDAARDTVRAAITGPLYATDKGRAPLEQKQSFFDFVNALAVGGGSAFQRSSAPVDAASVGRGIDTLVGFPQAPFWDVTRTNCDEAEVASKVCVLDDGTTVELLGEVGWNGDLVATTPIPLALRPPSNFFWRSNPYTVNGGGDGTRLLPAVDFRLAYWLARWAR
jgi:hypothetical protein